MDEITKGQTGQRRLTLDECRLGFIEERLGECPIMSNTLDDRVARITRKCHSSHPRRGGF
jgi:hypothetical protein